MIYINGTNNENDIEVLEESGMLQRKYNSKEELQAMCKLKKVDYDKLIIVDDRSRKKIMRG